jgi:hypothetical protein
MEVTFCDLAPYPPFHKCGEGEQGGEILYCLSSKKFDL